jgi:diguanylate cyclase (GGDEF)-like protein
MKSTKLYSRLSLRWKVLVPFVAVSLAVSFTGAWLLGRSLENQVYTRADEEVRHEAAMAATYIERERSYIVSQLVLAVEEGKWLTNGRGNITDALSSVDMVTVMKLLGIGGDSPVKADFLKVIGAEGQTLVELNSDLLTARSLNDDGLIAKALAGSNAGEVVTSVDGKRVYLVAAAALPDNGVGRGAILMGTKLDQDLLSEIALPQRTLFAFTDDGIAACTAFGFRTNEWEQALSTATDGMQTVDDKQYVLATAPVQIDGQPSVVRVASAMPVDALAAETRGDWTRTWLIFAVGAAVLILAGLIITRNVVHPVRELTVAAGRLKDGDFDVRIESARGDEIGQLARAFNTMGEELKSRDERLAESFNEVKRLSETDALTGLLNHRTITERLSSELARAHRYGGRFGVMIIDLDNFKLLNDTYGHPIGDNALRHISTLLAREFRASDFISRSGGDEFMLVLPECGLVEVAGAAEKLQEALADDAFEAPDGSRVPIRMSVGVACYPDDGQDANTLIALADANLYLSKSRGGGTVTGAQIDNLSPEDISAFGMLGSLVTIVDNKDRYTRHHSEEVTAFAIRLGKSLGLSDESQRVLRVAGLLHDVGKIGVPDRILRKPGKMTDEEYEIIKQHTLLGDAIIAAIPDLAEIRAAVAGHHERYDGKGYPSGIAGERIPLLARILTVSDSYSAMITDRPYRKALSLEEARAELIAGKGTQFDPTCVDAFLGCLDAASEPILVRPAAATLNEC